MAVPEDSPSPVMPIIVLVILGTMMTLSSMMAYDPTYWTSTIEQVQTHFVAGAFLIPICLLLAVQAFGIPRVNPMEPPASSPLLEAVSQNLTTSILLVFVIFVLLMLLPLRNVVLGSWEPPPTSARNGW